MTVVKVVEGVIAEVKPKEMEMSEEDKAKKAMEDEAKKKDETAMQTQMSKQLSEIESLKNENKSLKDAVNKNTKSINLLLSVFNALEETPVEDIKASKKEKSYEEMTKYEQVLFSRGKL
jgi:predicted RNase H-like nuclease (RuvC/YqgF family)